jgi:formamidase
MVKTLISVDLNKSPEEQSQPLHNRWHPDIPALVSVKPGETFRVETIDWTGGQIKDNDCANDMRDIELRRVHYMSGPIAVSGAKPGDLLVVDILDIGTVPDSEWGFTGIFAKQNGGSFLTDYYPEAAKAIWNFDGIYAHSRHIPGVRFAGITHPGIVGTAPSAELLKQWNKREADLIKTNPNRIPPLACPPDSAFALMGTMKNHQTAAQEAARTIAPRENGGNCDIKNLSRGSRLFLPVYVNDANLSVGDLHFSQGDGEISFCGGIEMAGWLTMHVDIIKDGMNKYKVTNPIAQPGPVEPRYSDYLIFEGISVDTQGKQYYLDAHVAYQRACLNAIEYLKQFGYTGEQAYMILSTAPVEGRLSGVVDIPNACCTLALPTAIFDFPIKPTSDGPRLVSRGDVARTT